MELTPTIKMLQQATNRLSDASKEIFRLAQKKAETEREYRMELAKVIFRLRDEKIPATIIGDCARGEVAELKFQRDLAADMYRSALSAMEALKSEINAIQTITKYTGEI
ncbi:MAG: hypothetical protein WED82_00585, partial [Balneolales bacterium]